MRKFKLIHLMIVFSLFMFLQSGGKGCSCGGGGDGIFESKTPPPEPTPILRDFNILNGEWIARDGTGTASGSDGSFALRLQSGKAKIEIMSVTNNGAIVNEFVDFTWDAYYNNRFINAIDLYDYFPKQTFLTRTSNNTFRYTFSGGKSVIDITILSETSAYVEEKGVYTFTYSGGSYENYAYSAQYYMDKKGTAPNPPSIPDDFEALSGVWNATNGSGSTYGPDGKFDLKLVYGKARIDVLNITGDSATVAEYVDFEWEVSQGGAYVRTIKLYDDITELATVKRIAARVFEYTFPSGSKIKITLLSDTKAFVEEKGTFHFDYYIYTYSGSYYMEKQ